MAELELRMGSKEASEWRAWFSLAEQPSPAVPPPAEDPLHEGDKLYAKLVAMFGNGKRDRHA